MRSSSWLLPLLLLSSSTNGASGECSEEIVMRRDQVIKAKRGVPLKVECAVNFCSETPPRVSWIKSTNGSDKDKPRPALESRWEGRNNTSGVSYLTFTHLLLKDSGEYRCETNFTKGHFININVTGSAEVSVEVNNGSAEVSVEVNNGSVEVSVEVNNDRGAERWGLDQLRPYLWASAGVILCVVVVVSLSVVFLQRCSGDPRRTVKYQNTVMPMTLLPSAHSNPGQAPPSDTPLSIASPHRPAQSPSTANRTSQRGHLYGNRGEAEEEKEEDQSIWYAALNHDVMRVAPIVRRRDSVQDTEYAAIHITR